MWIYSQSTGQLFFGKTFVYKGYSGYKDGKNNPMKQAIKATGPIPRGLWQINKTPYNSARVGPYAIILEAETGTETFGRTAFRIHGDSKSAPGTASRGCIIMPRAIREQIIASKIYTLKVVE